MLRYRPRRKLILVSEMRGVDDHKLSAQVLTRGQVSTTTPLSADLPPPKAPMKALFYGRIQSWGRVDGHEGPPHCRKVFLSVSSYYLNPLRAHFTRKLVFFSPQVFPQNRFKGGVRNSDNKIFVKGIVYKPIVCR